MTTKIRVETKEYEASHCRLPRGRGGWIFAFGTNPDDQATWSNFNGTYTEARRQAVAVAKTLEGVNTIWVLP